MSRAACRALKEMLQAESREQLCFNFCCRIYPGEQQGRYSWQPAPCLPSEPFCHAPNEVSPGPGEPTLQKAGVKLQ